MNRCPCGAYTSKYGVSLIVCDSDDARCLYCAQRDWRNWFPLTMGSVFEMVERIPWVPTEVELRFWNLWNIDHWFSKRTI